MAAKTARRMVRVEVHVTTPYGTRTACRSAINSHKTNKTPSTCVELQVNFFFAHSFRLTSFFQNNNVLNRHV